MTYKVPLGDGKFCYTINCQRHARVSSSLQKKVGSVVNRDDPDWGEYYLGTEKKHLLDPQKPGSKFISPNLATLEDVLVLALTQRGDLDGDDRDFFIKNGCSSDVFKEGFRYLKVITPGKLGVISSTVLDDSVEVKVERTKPGAPCNFVLEVDHQPLVDYGVIILEGEGDNARLITMFPGAPTYVSLSETGKQKVDSWEGETFTVGELRNRMGRDVTVNTRLVP